MQILEFLRRKKVITLQTGRSSSKVLIRLKKYEVLI